MDNLSALLIIDVQRGFINKHTKNIPSLAESIQEKYKFVYVAQLEYEEHSPFLDIRKSSGFSDVDNPTELAFIPTSKSKIIKKHGYSAATPQLLFELEKNNIRQINLMGIDTDQCVLATALALFDQNITPRVLSGYCASTGGASMHKSAIKIMKRALGSHNVV